LCSVPSTERMLAQKNEMQQYNIQICLKIADFWLNQRIHRSSKREQSEREKGSEFCDSICLNWSGAGLTIFFPHKRFHGTQ
jgi:hypothetical protein